MKLAKCRDEHGLHWYMNWPRTVMMFVGGMASGVREEDLLRE